MSKAAEKTARTAADGPRYDQRFVRPATRGELADRLRSGETCEVVGYVAEMTAIMLRGWIGVENFTITESPHDGWVLFVPNDKAQVRGETTTTNERKPMSNETAKHTDQPASERSCPDPSGYTPTEAELDEMVNRFLAWRLPDDFAPDAGINFTPPEKLYPNVSEPKHLWPTGTNLLDADQTRQMLRHILTCNTD